VNVEKRTTGWMAVLDHQRMKMRMTRKMRIVRILSAKIAGTPEKKR
jgi:hypothetical protein